MTFPEDKTRVAARPQPASTPIPSLGSLTIVTSPDHGQVDSVVQLRGADTTIGRDSAANITLNDVDCSRFHARIIVRDSAHYLVDMQSTNGSQVNGARVDEVLLRTGDTILLGSTSLRYKRN